MVDLTDSPSSRRPLAPADLVGPGITRAAPYLHAHGTAEATLDAILEVAPLVVPCDDAGILLITSRGGDTHAVATSADAERAHDLQRELDEGPCLDAIDGDVGDFLVRDTADDARWRRWGPAAAELGYRSVVSVRLATLDRRYGSLNLYAARPDAFGPVDLERVVAFTRIASVALAAAQDRDGLQRAIDGRRGIGIAMGILMERYELPASPAFDVLKRYSQHHNVKLRDVARTLVEEGELPEQRA